jgi:hypothetical protein
MFCRFCGTNVLDDSIFCAKCGKRLRGSGSPRLDHLEKLGKTLHLRTPYPYAIFLVLAVAVWALLASIVSQANRVDYTSLLWTMTENRKLDLPKSNLYQQAFSLVLENKGSKAARDIPVDLLARIEPPQAAEIIATFRGSRWLIMTEGKTLPLTLILTDEIHPGSKRSFPLEGSIQAQPPFKVTYEIREEGSETVLAHFVVAR